MARIQIKVNKLNITNKDSLETNDLPNFVDIKSNNKVIKAEDIQQSQDALGYKINEIIEWAKKYSDSFVEEYLVFKTKADYDALRNAGKIYEGVMSFVEESGELLITRYGLGDVVFKSVTGMIQEIKADGELMDKLKGDPGKDGKDLDVASLTEDQIITAKEGKTLDLSYLLNTTDKIELESEIKKTNDEIKSTNIEQSNVKKNLADEIAERKAEELKIDNKIATAKAELAKTIADLDALVKAADANISKEVSAVKDIASGGFQGNYDLTKILTIGKPSSVTSYVYYHIQTDPEHVIDTDITGQVGKWVRLNAKPDLSGWVVETSHFYDNSPYGINESDVDIKIENLRAAIKAITDTLQTEVNTNKTGVADNLTSIATQIARIDGLLADTDTGGAADGLIIANKKNFELLRQELAAAKLRIEALEKYARADDNIITNIEALTFTGSGKVAVPTGYVGVTKKLLDKEAGWKDITSTISTRSWNSDAGKTARITINDGVVSSGLINRVGNNHAIVQIIRTLTATYIDYYMFDTAQSKTEVARARLEGGHTSITWTENRLINKFEIWEEATYVDKKIIMEKETI